MFVENFLRDINQKRERNLRGRVTERKHASDDISRRAYYIVQQRCQPYLKHAKNLFRRNLPKGLPFSCNWIGGTGIQHNYSTYEAFITLSYDIQYRGLRLMRTFAPKQDADIVAEAWRISGIILAWSDEKAGKA